MTLPKNGILAIGQKGAFDDGSGDGGIICERRIPSLKYAFIFYNIHDPLNHGPLRGF